MPALLLVLLLALALPAPAAASPRQFSILQDDAVFLGFTDKDPEQAMAEAKALGTDYVRLFLTWQRVSPDQQSEAAPAGFEVGDPESPGYDWARYDAFIERARRHGLKVFINLTAPIPHWASEEPDRCPHRIGGYRRLGRSCMWKPQPRLFGQFAKAVARRYAGRVDLYSIWNEPNLEHYLYPQLRRTRHGVVDLAAKRYRALWYEGWKEIAAYDPRMRDRVLFGETAAISSPMDTLYAALCLDELGRPYRGTMRKLMGCKRPRRLPIGGVAHHPYNNFARGTVFTRSFTKDSLPVAYVSRLHRLMDTAARHGRIPPGKGIYLTEFGFQSNPPDRRRGLPLRRHATAINEAERLYFADRRVRSISQFELYDVPDTKREDVYNTGLRQHGGRRKPAWAAFRMPLVVTAVGPGVVEVWGQVRPATGRVRAVVRAGVPGRPSSVVANPRTNRAGYFRFRLRRGGATQLRYRLEWTSPSGTRMRSRLASAGRPIRYLER